MQLAIAQNPHLVPEAQKELWDQLNMSSGIPEDVFDREGLKGLKSMLSNSAGMIVK